MKTKFTFLVIFLISIFINGQNKSIPDFKILDNIKVNSAVYSVYAKSENEKFTLKICNVDTCAITQEYIKTMDSGFLVSDVIEAICKQFDSSADTAATKDEKKRIENLIEKLKASDLATLKASKNELENLLYIVDNEKDQYSAKIILNKKIPYKIAYSKKSKSIADVAAKKKGLENILESIDSTTNNRFFKESIKDSLKALFNQKINYSTNTSVRAKDAVLGADTLKIIDAQIQFFNNKASSIYIKAEYIKGALKESLIIINNNFSVPLRYFNNYGSTVSTETKNRDLIFIDYNDVFDYESDQYFNYSIANSHVALSNEIKDKNSSKVVQRRFFDFFTAVIYTDVMGFNTDNSNSLLNTQAKLLLPLNLRNIKKYTIGRQIITTANIALNNSFEDESRFINIKNDDNFSHFELLKKNNLYGKLQLDVFTHEAKGWFTNISLGYNVGFYRTGMRYTQTKVDETDIIIERQLLSIGHGAFLNFEIRPQTNFGADITFSLEDLNYSDVDSIGDRSFKNDVINETDKDHFVIPYNLINMEANFYWLTNPGKSKGGIYAKLGSYFHTDSNSIFPQIMVGYATNLTSFVNRSKPKKIKKTDIEE